MTSVDDDVKAAFALADSQGEGQISAHELRHIFRDVLVGFTEQDLDVLFSRTTMNKDGTLDYNALLETIWTAGTSDQKPAPIAQEVQEAPTAQEVQEAPISVCEVQEEAPSTVNNVEISSMQNVASSIVQSAQWASMHKEAEDIVRSLSRRVTNRMAEEAAAAITAATAEQAQKANNAEVASNGAEVDTENLGEGDEITVEDLQGRYSTNKADMPDNNCFCGSTAETEAAALKIQSIQRGRRVRNRVKGRRKSAEAGLSTGRRGTATGAETEAAALKIQSVQRGREARKQVKDRRRRRASTQ